MDNNPLTDFVDLPSEYSALSYCQMICGIIRGALEMVQLEVTATVEKVTTNHPTSYHVTKLPFQRICSKVKIRPKFESVSSKN